MGCGQHEGHQAVLGKVPGPARTHHGNARLLVVPHAPIHGPNDEDVFGFGLPVQQRCGRDLPCSQRGGKGWGTLYGRFPPGAWGTAAPVEKGMCQNGDRRGPGRGLQASSCKYIKIPIPSLPPGGYVLFWAPQTPKEPLCMVPELLYRDTGTPWEKLIHAMTGGAKLIPAREICRARGLPKIHLPPNSHGID